MVVFNANTCDNTRNNVITYAANASASNVPTVQSLSNIYELHSEEMRNERGNIKNGNTKDGEFSHTKARLPPRVLANHPGKSGSFIPGRC